MSDISQNKMGTKPILPLLIGMSVPAMFSMLIQALYNVVDSIFVARIGSDALSAVSLAYPLQLVLISFAIGTAIGVNSLIARRLGAKNYEDANSAATHGMILAFFGWILFVIVGLLFSKPFIALFTTNEKIVTYGTQYLTIVLFASFGLFIAAMGEKTLQATGNMIFPMVSQLIGAITNIILDPIFIFGLFGFPKLEVIGAAVATVIGQIVSMIFILIVLFTKDHEVKIMIRKFKFSWRIVKDIYAVGFPAIIMQSIGSVMVSGINAILSMANIATLTCETYINIFGVYFKLQSFVFMPVFGLNQGTSPIIGYNYGARNKSRMFKAFSIALIISCSIMGLGLIAFQFASGWILSLFDASELMIELGIPTLKIISLSFIFAGAGIMFSALYQAIGKGFYSMMLSICRQLVMLLPIAFILSKVDIALMWYAFPISECGCLILALIFFMRLKKREFKKLDEPLESTKNLSTDTP